MAAHISKVYRPGSDGGKATPYFRMTVTRQTARMTVTEDEAREFHESLNGFFGPLNVTFWQWLKHRFGKR